MLYVYKAEILTKVWLYYYKQPTDKQLVDDALDKLGLKDDKYTEVLSIDLVETNHTEKD
jgi:hypothetical protein